MDAISRLCEKIRSTPNAEFSPTGTKEAAVQEVEHRLGVDLPTQYRTFLKELGYAIWDGRVINGIGGPDGYCNLVKSTLESRDASHLPPEFVRVPHAGVVLATYAGGGDYFLHDESSDTPGKVSLFLDENAGAEEKSWNTFLEFLEDLVLRNNG